MIRARIELKSDTKVSKNSSFQIYSQNCVRKVQLKNNGFCFHRCIDESNRKALVLKALIQNLVQNGRVVNQKIWFEFLYVHDLGPSAVYIFLLVL